MKKNLLFTAIILALFSCNNNDNSSIEPQNPNENETTMKLKEFRALATSKYFYHENGFVDSISTSRAGNIPTEIQTKLHYNSENKLISMERWVDVSNETIYENDIFEYNNENLIITKKVYDQNQNLKQNFNYTYDSDGYLNNSNLTYIEGNLVQDGSFTYSYDNKKNPFFEMYPTAYIRMNQINKNNQTSTNNATETLENINWSYNQNGYPVSFQKSPVLPDDIDFAEYIYY
nr:hypothetical protein [uncultured Flavobacterium sp.]